MQMTELLNDRRRNAIIYIKSGCPSWVDVLGQASVLHSTNHIFFPVSEKAKRDHAGLHWPLGSKRGIGKLTTWNIDLGYETNGGTSSGQCLRDVGFHAKRWINNAVISLSQFLCKQSAVVAIGNGNVNVR